jgi:hypothetical protein
MMTNGQYTRDLARFEHALTHGGNLPTVEQMQEGAVPSAPKDDLESVKRKVFSVANNGNKANEEGKGEGGGGREEEEEEDDVRHDKYKSYSQLNERDDKVDSDMDDNLYIWQPSGPEETPVLYARPHVRTRKLTQTLGLCVCVCV